MRYLWVSLVLSLRTQLRSARFWLALLLALAAGLLARTGMQPVEGNGAVEVGVAVVEGSESFWASLERRSSALVRFVQTDEPTARAKVASSQWDCALLLPEDFGERLETGERYGLITLLTGPGSTVYPLVQEAVSAALLEQTSNRIASDYLHSSGITGEVDLPEVQQVRLEMETLSGQPLSNWSWPGRACPGFSGNPGRRAAGLDAVHGGGPGPLAGNAGRAPDAALSGRRSADAASVTGGGVSGVFVRRSGDFCRFWAVRLGERTGFAAVSGGAGGAGAAAGGGQAALERTSGCDSFAAAGAFVLSPVFADITLFFPPLEPLCSWLPVTLYLRCCEDGGAAVRLMVLTGILAFFAVLAETLREKRRKNA